MSFNLRLNSLFSVLGCSNADIARLCSVDSSLISRFRTGVRTPRRNTSQFEKLCGGIATYAEKMGINESIKESFGLPGLSSLKNEIGEYLLPSENRAKSKDNIVPFSEKLNALMIITKTANKRLAAALKVDSSLISRFRSGSRLPAKDGRLIEELCSHIYKNAVALGCEDKLAELMGVNVSRVRKVGFPAYLSGWLMGDAGIYNADIIDSFLEKLSEYKQDFSGPPISPADLIKEAHNDKNTEFSGDEGLRQAVMRLLADALSNAENGDYTLKLYSNFSLNALYEKPEYFAKLRAAIKEFIKKGGQIAYINDISMSLDEIISDIIKWLPLYMRGCASSYYYHNQSGSRFSNILCAAGRTAVCGSFAAGTGGMAGYSYYSAETDVSYFHSQFASLLISAKPLVQIYTDRNTDRYFSRLGEMADRDGKTLRLLPSLSLCTMPRQLLNKILERSGILGSKTDRILYLHDVRVRQFKRELARGGVIEYTALPDKEALLSGRARINMAEMCIDLPLPYSDGEFSEHIAAIIRIMEENENYSVYNLKDNPYNNIQVIFKEKTGAVIIRDEEPTLALWLEHEAACGAFKAYFETAHTRCAAGCEKKPAAASRASLISELKKYIG
jgi:hypothetical protein